MMTFSRLCCIELVDLWLERQKSKKNSNSLAQLELRLRLGLWLRLTEIEQEMKQFTFPVQCTYLANKAYKPLEAITETFQKLEIKNYKYQNILAI